MKYADFRQITRSRSRTTPVATHDELRTASLDLIRSVLPTSTGISLVGVTISNFCDRAAAPATLPLVAA